MDKSKTFNFLKADRLTEMQKDEFYNFCVTNLETGEKFWTDNAFESKEAAKSVEISLIWKTKDNKEL